MEKMIQKHKILRDAWNQLDDIFEGIAIPCEKDTAEGGTIRSEKVLKFAKTSRKRGRVMSDYLQQRATTQAIWQGHREVVQGLKPTRPITRIR